MSENRDYHVTVSLAHDFQFIADFEDVPGGATIALDEPPPLGEAHGPNAAALLGAAVGNCLAASLTFCLKRAHIDVAGMTAHISTHVGRNEQGRHRITGIDVELSPALSEANASRIGRCEELFEDFCTVTASVRHGIPVMVSLRTVKEQTAA